MLIGGMMTSNESFSPFGVMPAFNRCGALRLGRAIVDVYLDFFEQIQAFFNCVRKHPMPIVIGSLPSLQFKMAQICGMI